jgi:hypothetical protein
VKAESSFNPINGGAVDVLKRIDTGARLGLESRARVIWREWKKQMQLHHGGFTTGDFQTGTAQGKITLGPVLAMGQIGQYSVQVGTSLLYHLFWELGHMNLFTGKYERVETLRPAIEDSRAEQEAAFLRQFLRAVNA